MRLSKRDRIFLLQNSISSLVSWLKSSADRSTPEKQNIFLSGNRRITIRQRVAGRTITEPQAFVAPSQTQNDHLSYLYRKGIVERNSPRGSYWSDDFEVSDQ